MVREAWNSVHAVHKQVVQERNIRKQCFDGFYLVKFGKSILIITNINYINWITGIEFHKLQILEVFLLDNCVFYQCWKFDNIRLKPCKDIVREILVIGVFGHLTNMASKFSFGHWETKLVLWTGRGLNERGGGYVERFYINVSLNTRIYTSHRNVNKYKERRRWHRKQCSGPWCKIRISTHL